MAKMEGTLEQVILGPGVLLALEGHNSGVTRTSASAPWCTDCHRSAALQHGAMVCIGSPIRESSSCQARPGR